MGEEEVRERPGPRVVLDTSVFISATLFGGGPGRLVTLWQQDQITLLLSSEVLKEYLRVLSYPRFQLTGEEIKFLVEVEVMPFSEPVKTRTRLRIIDEDFSDNKFLELVVDGKADVVVSGDKRLLDLASYEGIEIISVTEFLKRID
ncbi:MAG: putative toxin-antitoxin system toxin component, PIN family [Clostridiales bacterium]|nr:putative toxin-antitoxin system toxin component, PIN family [Clostridiales bacterium]